MKKLSLSHRTASHRAVFTLAFATLAPALPIAAAQNGEEFRVSAGVGYRADADIDHHRGDFNETRFGATVTRSFILDERWRIDPVVGYRFSAYDFSKSEPWDNVHQLRATVMMRHKVNEKWAVFGGPTAGLAIESGADVGDALTFGGAIGVTYQVNERLAVGGGVGVTTQIEDNATVRPVLILNWRINDRWTAESGYFEVAGGGGPGAEIRYQINDHWSVSGGMQYQENRFRLAEDQGPARDGVGEDTFTPVYAKVTWQASQHAAFELLGGIALGGELRLENRNGHKLSDEDYDPAPLVGLRAVLTF